MLSILLQYCQVLNTIHCVASCQVSLSHRLAVYLKCLSIFDRLITPARFFSPVLNALIPFGLIHTSVCPNQILLLVSGRDTLRSRLRKVSFRRPLDLERGSGPVEVIGQRPVASVQTNNPDSLPNYGQRY